MQFARETIDVNYKIQSYAPGLVRVADKDYHDSILVAEHALRSWDVTNLANMQQNNLRSIIDLDPKIVIFGSGAKLVFPPDILLCELQQQGIGFEVMLTDAACRTYAILSADQRKAVAALII